MASLAFSLYRFHDVLHPRGPVSPRSRAKAATDVDAMVDISVNPIDPPVALRCAKTSTPQMSRLFAEKKPLTLTRDSLRLCPRKIDFLPNAEGKLLIGTSANSVLTVVVAESVSRLCWTSLQPNLTLQKLSIWMPL